MCSYMHFSVLMIREQSIEKGRVGPIEQKKNNTFIGMDRDITHLVLKWGIQENA